MRVAAVRVSGPAAPPRSGAWGATLGQDLESDLSLWSLSLLGLAVGDTTIWNLATPDISTF